LQDSGTFTGLASGDILKAVVTAQDGITTNPYTITVTVLPYNATDLTNAINSIPANGTGTITLPDGAHISLAGPITISDYRDVTITVSAGQTATLERTSFNGSLINVDAGSTLNLTPAGSLVIDGGYDGTLATASNAAAITVRGELVLEDGVTIKNNKNTRDGEGGGVYVDAGSMTMNGGSIEYNEGVDGGGVSVVDGGYFEMTGGYIQHNEVNGSGSSPDGGGVLVNAGGHFVMTSGEICYNTAARSGGGVAVYSGGAGALFEMSGGSIHDNISNGGTNMGGGGVHVWRGTFTMSGTASIYDNTAASGGNGGGVMVYKNSATNSIFTMNGGTITGNISNILGTGVGGVYNSGGTVNGAGLSGITLNTPVNTDGF
jgi:hypothetical protein